MYQIDIFYPIIIVLVVLILSKGLFTVEQQYAYVVERFGKFVRVADAGLNFKIPFIEKISGKVNLRVMQLDVQVETKTQDDVFINIMTSVQFQIIADKIYQAFYTLDNADSQIQSFVFDVVRATVPNIKLDDVFAKKDEIADSVRLELREMMSDFGYNIIKTLVTDINPDAKVKAAMNEINEAQRLRIAANERGEAEKILKVKLAEAEAQSNILQGKGIAGQRKEIIEGLKQSISDLKSDLDGLTTPDVMNIILLTQYFDTIKDLSKHSQLNTILLPHSPGAISDLQQQIRDSIIIGNQVKK